MNELSRVCVNQNVLHMAVAEANNVPNCRQQNLIVMDNYAISITHNPVEEVGFLNLLVRQFHGDRGQRQVAPRNTQ